MTDKWTDDMTSGTDKQFEERLKKLDDIWKEGVVPNELKKEGKLKKVVGLKISNIAQHNKNHHTRS